MKKYSVKIPVTAQVKMEYSAIIEADTELELQAKILELEMANAKQLQESGSLMLTKKLVIDEILAVHVLDEGVHIGEVGSTQRFGYPC